MRRKQKTSTASFRGVLVFWYRRQDAYCFAICTAHQPSAWHRAASSHHSATEQFTGLFRFTPRASLRFKSFLYKNKHSLFQRCACFLVQATGLEPASQRHQNLNLARLPIPPRLHIKTKSENGKFIFNFPFSSSVQNYLLRYSLKTTSRSSSRSKRVIMPLAPLWLVI